MVAVHGCGPIGLLLVQTARNAGATQIIAMEPIALRRSKALEFGATHAIPLDGDQVKAILRFNNDPGVDTAFEAAGENGAVWDAVGSAKPGGRVVLIGTPDEGVTTFRASAARHKGLTVLVARRMKHTNPRCISLVRSGKIGPRSLAAHQFPFDRAPRLSALWIAGQTV